MIDFSSASALSWVQKILALALVFQSIELFRLRDTLKEDSVWSWNVLRQEFKIFPAPIPGFLDLLLSYPAVLLLIGIQLTASLGLFFSSQPIPILFLSTTLLSLRWRGTFNGGSDFMTLLVLLSLGFAALLSDHPLAQEIALGYIGIQTCTSYFVSGFIKLKKKNWRTGRALQGFLRSTIYKPTPFTRTLCKSRALSQILSWTVMLFEVSFPLTLFNPRFCIGWLGLALVFHLGNFYLFGLNRFIFAWGAAYPALFWCSLKLAQ